MNRLWLKLLIALVAVAALALAVAKLDVWLTTRQADRAPSPTPTAGETP